MQNDQIKTLHKEYITFQFTEMGDSQHFGMCLLPFLILQKTKVIQIMTFETATNEWLEVRKICQLDPQLSWLSVLVFPIFEAVFKLYS